jgi:hypothetical protein
MCAASSASRSQGELCRPRDAPAPPQPALAEGARRAAQACAAGGTSRARRDEHALSRPRDATALLSRRRLSAPTVRPMCVPPPAQALAATGPPIDGMSERAIAAAGASACLTLRPTSAPVGISRTAGGEVVVTSSPPTSRRCPRCQRRRRQRRQQQDRRRRRARGDDGDEDGSAGDEDDDAGGESASPTGSYSVDSHGHDLCIGHLTSVHACGAAIGELDLRLLDLEDRIGTVASEALATAHGTETTRTFVGGPATCVATLERALGDALRPHAAPAAP